MGKSWAVGVDLGGTKVEAALVNEKGLLQRRIRRATDVEGGPEAVEKEIVAAVTELQDGLSSRLTGVGIGVAGQIEPSSGIVRFAPNLDWRDVRLEDALTEALDLPIVVTNDVRAATWGEWLYGAGQGFDDLICIFVGTGIGGGVIVGGHLLDGCTHTAGEIGHIVIDINGPLCHCGNRGCLESLVGGWAIARQAQDAIINDPVHGAGLLKRSAGKLQDVTAKTVAEAALAGDRLALDILEEVSQALIAGVTSLVNTFNPCLLILGGGVIEGLPQLPERIARGVHEKALNYATTNLQIRPAQLHNDSGVIGAAALVMHQTTKKG
jgi:glucokinase